VGKKILNKKKLRPTRSREGANGGGKLEEKNNWKGATTTTTAAAASVKWCHKPKREGNKEDNSIANKHNKDIVEKRDSDK
jgi:hypothetical protein